MTSIPETWAIRPAREQDMQQLAEIYLRVRRETFLWVDPGHFTLDDFAAHTNGERLFVCEDEHGVIAGFAAIWEPDDFIHMLYLLPDFQGRGAGKALLAGLPDWPERRYRLKCLVKNMRAMAFYRRRGFEIIGDGASPEGDYKEMRLADISSL